MLPIGVAKFMEPKPGAPVPPPFVGHVDPVADEPADHSSPIPVPKVVRRWLPLIKLVGPSLVALIAAVGAARKGQDEVAGQTDRGYALLYPKAEASEKRFKAIETSINQLAQAIQVQGRLILAAQPGFTPAGLPAPIQATPLTPAARRKKAKRLAPAADPELVKKVQVQAVKTLAEIQQRAANPAPVTAPLPPTIPAQLPPPAPLPSPPPATIPLLPAETK
jgi:hypothetical protein